MYWNSLSFFQAAISMYARSVDTSTTQLNTTAWLLKTFHQTGNVLVANKEKKNSTRHKLHMEF